MRRFLLIVLSLILALFALTAGIAWYLLHSETFLKSRLTAYMLEETGRELTVEQTLRVKIGRRLLVIADDIRLQNASWAEDPYMARVGRLRAVLDLPSLFADTTIVHSLRVEDCRIDLIETDAGSTNWDDLMALGDDTEEESAPATDDAVPFLFRDNTIRNCKLTHRAPSREQPLSLEIEEFDLGLIDDIRWQGSGRGKLNGESLALSGWLEPAGVFINGGALEHDLDIEIGQVSLESQGTVQDVYSGQGADIRLRFQGPEIANVLGYFDLPPVSTGEFDFRLSLDSRDQMTRLDVDGDLGTIQAQAEGEVDRLVDPTTGRLKGSIGGPDLAALGSAMGIDGLSSGGYALEADIGFEPGLVRFNTFELEMPADRLAVSGLLGTDATRAGTDLDVSASAGELGHWMAVIGQPDREIGPVKLNGRLLSDADGQGKVQARLEYLQSTLTVVGKLGSLGGPLRPDLDIDLNSSDISPLSVFLDDYELPAAAVSLRGHVTRPQEAVLLDNVLLQLDGHRLDLKGRVNPEPDLIGSELEIQLSSPNASALGALFKQQGLPLAPFMLSARIGRPDQRIRLQDVALDVDGHKVSANGWLNPDDQFTGSELELELETADVAALALLFGEEGLPHEPMTLGADLKASGGGLQFQTRQGTIGDIRLALEGSIPDLNQPLGVDARFDIQLPSLRLLEFLAEDTELPDLPFSAHGALRNEQDQTHFEDVRWRLGDIEAEIQGSWHTDRRVDLSIAASGPDASQLQDLLGRPLDAEPFSIRTRVKGDADVTKFTDIDVRLGKSQVVGELQIALGPPRRLTGFLESPFLDLSPLTAPAKDEPQPAEPASPFVFDDTEIMRVDDYDIDIDVALTADELNLGNTQLYDAKLHVLLDHKRLELAPFSVRGKRGGTLYGQAVLDDSGSKPALQAKLEGEDLRLGLIAGPGQSESTYPPVELHISLRGTGLTRREMASALSGKARIFVGSGEIASAGVRLLFSDFLTELFTQLDPTTEEREFAPLECSVVAANIVDGQVDLEPVVLHMEDFTVIAEGKVDLGSEKINVTFNTKPRKGLGITPGTVINTLVKAGGTLKQPTVELDPEGAIVASATAIATAGLSIVAKSFSDRFLSSKDPCGDARKDLEKRDK